jgi:integral membrane protein
MRKILRTVGLLEALSFLILLGVAMPMKYYLDMPAATKVPGMIHGLLFLGYIVLASWVAEKENWPSKQLWLAYVAGVLPFGTLVYDRKFFSTPRSN